MFMNYFLNKFHATISSTWLVIATEPKARENSYMDAMFYFTFYKKCNKSHVFEDLFPNVITETYITWHFCRSHPTSSHVHRAVIPDCRTFEKHDVGVASSSKSFSPNFLKIC
jgi:hypothetical protein